MSRYRPDGPNLKLGVKWCGEQHPHNQHLYALPEPNPLAILAHCPGSLTLESCNCTHHHQDTFNPPPPTPVAASLADQPPQDFQG